MLAPLAVQEHLVWRINSVIEGFNGHRTVTVQNDAWVDSQGNPVATGVVRTSSTCCIYTLWVQQGSGSRIRHAVL